MGDRLIPTRARNNWQTAFHMKEEINPAAASSSSSTSAPSSGIRTNRDGPPSASNDAGRDRTLFRCVLENEVLNSGIEDLRDLQTKKRRVFHVSIHFYLTFFSNDLQMHQFLL